MPRPGRPAARTLPAFAPAPANCVPSEVHAMSRIDPDRVSPEYAHPACRRSLAVKRRQRRAHLDRHETDGSCPRPQGSGTRDCRTSPDFVPQPPPDTTRPPQIQSRQHNPIVGTTTAHRGPYGFTTISFPREDKLSGGPRQGMDHPGVLRKWRTNLARARPPSHLHLADAAMAVPSKFQRTRITAPW